MNFYIVKKIFIWLIKAYRIFISPLFPPTCRFVPTCSQYAMEAIEKFGVFRGVCLAFWRILRCHPFCRGGYDPVPEMLNFNIKYFSRVINQSKVKENNPLEIQEVKKQNDNESHQNIDT